MILNAINIILFPSLQTEVDDEVSYISNDSELGAYFPHIVSTIGMAICRPVESSYLSIDHKQGFDEGSSIVVDLKIDRCVIDRYDW